MSSPVKKNRRLIILVSEVVQISCESCAQIGRFMILRDDLYYFPDKCGTKALYFF